MKRFLVTSAVLAVLIVSTWVNFIPVRCEVCHGVLFRTDVASMMFGGHGTCAHATCVPEFTQVLDPSRYRLELEPLAIPAPPSG